jgi:hypothetical protein
MKIARIHKLRARPTSANYQGNARDPQWVRLFQSRKKINLKLKISKLKPYSIQPKSRVVSIKPKFEVNTKGLTRVLSHQNLVKEEKNIDLALKTVKDFGSVLDKSLSLSKILAESSRFDISRPNTARVDFVGFNRPGSVRPEVTNFTRPNTARQPWNPSSRPNTARVAVSRSEKELTSRLELDSDNQPFREVIREIFKKK